MQTQNRLLIVGASARAAAFSARRSGLEVSALDLFADQDLRECARVEIVDRYPDGIAPLFFQQPAAPWLYTGGLENHPRLIDRLAESRALYGNPGAILRRVRDPFLLSRSLHVAGFRFPQLARVSADLPRDGSWLLKRYRSSGGQHVEPWLGQMHQRLMRPSHYFERRVWGEPVAALYLAAEHGALLLGVSRQLVGQSWCAAKMFHYCGSVGPLDLPTPLVEEFRCLGRHLAAEFGLRGLFGVDAILAGDARHAMPGFEASSDTSPFGSRTQLWPIEVNPRYPASAEVLERVLQTPLIGLHVDACRDRRLPIEPFRKRAHGVAGKAILFAPRDLAVGSEMNARLTAENRERSDPYLPAIADIPPSGSIIRAGWPMFTLLADGGSPEEVEQRLRARANQIYFELLAETAV